MSAWIFRILAPVLAVIAHGIAFCQFNSEINLLPLPPEWRGQFLFLLLLSLFFALLLPFCKSKVGIWLLFGFRGLIFWVIGLPMGGYLWVELTLATALIIEAFEYLPLREGLIASSGFLAITFGVQFLPISAWGINLKTALSNDLWSFAAYGGVIIILNSIIRFQRDNRIPAAEIKKNYQDILFQLGQVNLQLQEYATTVEQETLLNERKRLMREVHDTLAYTLTNLVMMLEAAKFLVNPGERKLLEQLELAHAQANDGLTEVHRALQALQPVHLSKVSGLQAIQQLVATFAQATRIEIDLDLGNAPLHFGNDADLVAYRFVQEGITNALRHGRATMIAISISLVGNIVHILIKDNGIGADGLKEGYGLAGMRERIERLGGKLEISSNSGFGFRLLAKIPV